MKIRRIFLTLLLVCLSGTAYATCDSPMAVSATTIPLSCTTTSSAVAYGVSAPCVAVENTGSVGVFIKSGTSSVAATVITSASANETYLAAGKGIVLTHPSADTHIACITASGTATVYAQSGTGD